GEGRGEAGGQGAVYGVRGRAALQPGGHGRGETVDIPYGEQEAGIVTAEVGQEGGGRGVVVAGGGFR
ncbi:hypothetical protein, partial [Streptomyces decoyicus]|uniref:hypothetical protein n=1 Tax=Streptomyces decoyicus TaxID=249567 RepID=UPI001ADF1B57